MSSSDLKTLEKCKKILNFYEELSPRKYCVKPVSHKKDQAKYHLPYSSASKSSSSLRKDFSFSKNQLSREEKSMSVNSSALKNRKSSNNSFVSSYCKESRLQKIMKLKVKPIHNRMLQNEKTKKSILNTSLSSMNSSRSQSNNKENHIKNQQSRLEKIMKIKVVKPKVHSTLVNYEPRQASKSAQKQKKTSAVKQWKQCREIIKKNAKQQEKEDRLWKVFERQRQLRIKLKKQAEEREYKQLRRKEKRFEALVNKQIDKIQRQKQLLKKQRASPFVLPSY